MNYLRCIQKILPLAYDDSLSYYEFLCKLMEKLNLTIEEINKIVKLFDDFAGSIDGKIESEVEKVTNAFFESEKFKQMLSQMNPYTEPDNFSGYNEKGLKECFEFAKNMNVPVMFKPNQKVSIDDGNIEIATETNFNGCEITKNTDNVLFNIQPGDTSGSLTIESDTEATNPVFGKYSTTLEQLFGKFFVVETPNALSSTAKITHAFLANKNGYYANGVRNDVPTNGTYKVYRYRVPDTPITISNAILKNVGKKMTGFFECRRDNVTFENFKIIGGVEQTGNWVGQFFVSRYCCNNVYRNIYSYESFAVSPSGGYIISGDTVANMIIDNCQFIGNSGSWGQVTFTFVNGLTIRNSTFNRLDWHYGCEGFCKVSDCCIDYFSWGGFIYDSCIFENCVFNTTGSSGCVTTRQSEDVSTYLNGFLTFKNCSFNRKNAGVILNIGNTRDTSDFMNCKNGLISFEKCSFDSGNHVDVAVINGNNSMGVLDLTFKDMYNDTTFGGYYWVNNDVKIRTLTFENIRGDIHTYFNANTVKMIRCTMNKGYVMGVDLKASQSGSADTIIFDQCYMGRVTNPVPCKNLVWSDCIISTNVKQLIGTAKGGITNCFIEADVTAAEGVRQAWKDTFNS